MVEKGLMRILNGGWGVGRTFTESYNIFLSVKILLLITCMKLDCTFTVYECWNIWLCYKAMFSIIQYWSDILFANYVSATWGKLHIILKVKIRNRDTISPLQTNVCTDICGLFAYSKGCIYARLRFHLAKYYNSSDVLSILVEFFCVYDLCILMFIWQYIVNVC